MDRLSERLNRKELNPFKKKFNKEQLVVFSLSVLIHIIIFLVLIVIEIRFIPVKNPGTAVQLILEALPAKNNLNENKPAKKVTVKSKRKEKSPVVKKRSSKEETAVVSDTNSAKQEINKPETAAFPDTGKSDLKYASTLLDTFLVRHPEYAKYILEQQGKNLVKDKKNGMFNRLEAEQRINDELHRYLKENFPEGSEHAMNPNGGPGMQIPIDGLIDAIKKIFK